MKIVNEYCKFCQSPKRSGSKKWYHWFYDRFCHCGIKVTELEEMDITQLKSEDFIMISDVSEKKSKKLKILTLMQYVNLNVIPQIEEVLKHK